MLSVSSLALMTQSSAGLSLIWISHNKDKRSTAFLLCLRDFSAPTLSAGRIQSLSRFPFSNLILRRQKVGREDLLGLLCGEDEAHFGGNLPPGKDLKFPSVVSFNFRKSALCENLRDLFVAI